MVTFQKLANVMRVSFMTMKIRSSFQFLWQDIWFHIVKLEFMCGDEYEMLNCMMEAVLMDNGIIWFDRISHGNPWITSKTQTHTTERARYSKKFGKAMMWFSRVVWEKVKSDSWNGTQEQKQLLSGNNSAAICPIFFCHPPPEWNAWQQGVVNS